MVIKHIPVQMSFALALACGATAGIASTAAGGTISGISLEQANCSSMSPVLEPRRLAARPWRDDGYSTRRLRKVRP